jgi:hypothetical protein
VLPHNPLDRGSQNDDTRHEISCRYARITGSPEAISITLALVGLEQAAEKAGFRMKLAECFPQGLKPTLILLPLRHD